MRHAAVAIALLLCAGCEAASDPNAIPAAKDIDRLEKMLSGHRCVGRLEEWERNYRFSRKFGTLFQRSINPDLEVIEFHFRKAGVVAIEPGRKVVAPKPDGDWPDSPPMRALDGRFTLTSGALSITPCKP